MQMYPEWNYFKLINNLKNKIFLNESIFLQFMQGYINTTTLINYYDN